MYANSNFCLYQYFSFQVKDTYFNVWRKVCLNFIDTILKTNILSSFNHPVKKQNPLRNWPEKEKTPKPEIVHHRGKSGKVWRNNFRHPFPFPETPQNRKSIIEELDQIIREKLLLSSSASCFNEKKTRQIAVVLVRRRKR